MKRAWPRRGLIAGLALTLGVTGLTVVTAGAAAVAAPHYDRPPSVQIGWNDSATPGKAYEAAEEHFPLGTWVDDAGKSHTSRVYATFDLSGFEGKTVYGGSVFIREQSAADCTKRAIEIWRTKPVGATPTWRKTPDPIAKLDEILTPEYCPGASISFEVGAAVKDAVAHKQRRITFELRVPAQFESDAAYGRRLNWYNTVQLSMQYNSAPKIDSDHLYNGGFACTQLKPPPRLGGFANVLQALATDADENDAHSLTTEFAVWPREDPEARSVHTQEHGTSGRVNTVNLPEGVLVDGKTYGWQARVGDGAELSAWSKKCFFTYDRTRPSTPVVTSANYPVDGAAPPGVPAVFTFSGHGDKDVAGFQYSWNGLGVNSCGGGGDLGELVCRDPLTLPGTIRANAPGGTATVTINPTGSGPQRLTVRSIDQAGNVSPETQYETFVPWSAPEVRVEGGKPEWNQDVLLKITPASGVTGVREYEITLDGGEPETRDADEDGVAYYSFRASDVNGHRVTVRSHSENGFVSTAANWSAYFDPWPGVRSDVYFYPEDGSAVGGVGVEGTFTFSPPPGRTDTASYRYSFVDGDELTEVAADEDGRATIRWTPTQSGPVTLTVYAVKADGTWGDYPNWYGFQVAGDA